jgi:hypothetical protein
MLHHQEARHYLLAPTTKGLMNDVYG